MRRLRDAAIGRHSQRFALEAAAAARHQPLLAAVDQRSQAALVHAIDARYRAIIPPIPPASARLRAHRPPADAAAEAHLACPARRRNARPHAGAP